jgi:hypothetical protein
MTFQRGLWPVAASALALIGALYAFERPFRVYPSMEPYDNIPLPPDWQEKAEWVFARLMYPQHPEARFGRFGRFGRRFGDALDWRRGFHQLDAGLSSRRPPLCGRRAAFDARSRAVGGTTREPRRPGRFLQLAVDECR